MIKRIQRTNQFKKNFRKLNNNQKLKFKNKLKLFIKNPGNPQFKFHKLTGKLSNNYAFKIEHDLRVVCQIFEDTLILINIGTHSEVYG